MARAKASWWKRVLSLVAPDGVLLLAAVVVLQLDALRDGCPPSRASIPTPCSWWARCWRGGSSATACCSPWSCWPSPPLALGSPGRGSTVQVIIRATAVLLPLNLAALALLPDRGTLTPIGLLRLGAIVVQVTLVVMFSRTAPAATAALLAHPMLPAKLLAWAPLRQPALFAFALALGAVVTPLLFETNATLRGFLWAILAAFLALTAYRPGPGAAIYLGTAGLVLVVSVIEASYLLAYQDGLTQLPTRRALTEAMQRLGGQYAIAMVDVDHFKRFNDEYGHDVGDHVLKMVAAKLAHVEGGGQARTATAGRSSRSCSRASRWTNPCPTSKPCAKRSRTPPSRSAAASVSRASARRAKASAARRRSPSASAWPSGTVATACRIR